MYLLEVLTFHRTATPFLGEKTSSNANSRASSRQDFQYVEGIPQPATKCSSFHSISPANLANIIFQTQQLIHHTPQHTRSRVRQETWHTNL